MIRFMNLDEPFVHSIEEMKPLVRFTEILLNVQNRVSSSKPSSSFLRNRGSIDKLEIRLNDPIEVSSLRNRCQELGYKLEGNYKKDKRFYLTVQFGLKYLDCYLGHPENNQIRKIIINPSKFKSWIETETFLLEVFGLSILEANLYRMDFTFDLFESYQKVLEGLRINHKRANTEFHGGTKLRTGLNVGAGNDKYVIYNKGEKENSGFPWTRIERQMSGRSLFLKKVKDLRTSAAKIIAFNPLAEIEINSITFNDPASFSSKLEKYNDLKSLVKHEGYFLAKKKLSQNRNFERDFAPFFQLIPAITQPQEVFNKDISTFFQEKTHERAN